MREPSFRLTHLWTRKRDKLALRMVMVLLRSVND